MRPLFTPVDLPVCSALHFMIFCAKVGDKPTRAYRTEAGVSHVCKMTHLVWVLNTSYANSFQVFSFTEFNDTMHVLVDRFLETRDGFLKKFLH